jgi:hypothetical protein
MEEYLGHLCPDANYIERCQSRSIAAEAEDVQRFEGEGEILGMEFGQVQKVVVSECRNALSKPELDDLVVRGLLISSIRQSEESVALHHFKY